MFLMSTYSASLYKATQKRYIGLAAMGYEPLYHALASVLAFFKKKNIFHLNYIYSGFPKETRKLKFLLRIFFRSATVCN